MAKLNDRQNVLPEEFSVVRSATGEALSWDDRVGAISSQEIKLHRKEPTNKWEGGVHDAGSVV